MLILTAIMIFSIVFYVYYKVSIVKSKDILTQKYFNGKSRMALGTFILVFGVNQYIYYLSTVSLIIGLVFLFFGGIQLVRGYREAKHYQKEWRRLNPQ